MAPCWIRWTRSRLTFSIGYPLAGSEAARDACDVLLPAWAEGEDEDVPHERGVLSETQHLPAAFVRDLAEAVAHGLVELGERRDDLRVFAVEPVVRAALVLLVQELAHVDGADDAAPVAPVLDESPDRRHVPFVGRRATDENDDLLRVGSPLELAHRRLEAVLHGLLPVATTLRHDPVEEPADLLAVEGEVTPLDEEVLALARGGPGLAVVAIAVRDRADTRRRDEVLDGRREPVQVVLQRVDHVLHAAGGIDDDGDVEADLAETAHVAPEGGAERPARAAATPPEAQAAEARPARGEAGPEVDTGADRADGPREMDDRRADGSGRLVRYDHRRVGGRSEQLVERLVRGGVARRGRGRQVLQGEEFATPGLAETGAASRADAEPGTDAESETPARSQHVENQQERDDRMGRCRDRDPSEEASRPRAGRRLEGSDGDHATGGALVDLEAPPRRCQGRRRVSAEDGVISLPPARPRAPDLHARRGS